ncbi:phosphatidate cytidylyltransferase [Candidatus Pelagibacter sp.]|nr:phosphatidate cytidylyltransferase [Candidatus Pelagibacter sp.]
MPLELKKRIITSIFLISLLALMFLYTFVMIISIIVIAIICWIEFYALISKIFSKRSNKDKIFRFFYKVISLIYLFLLVYLILLAKSKYPELNLVLIYSILISIMSDIGGLIIGKILKGKKLTKISPNKTISGAIGSFIFPLFLLPFFSNYFINHEILSLLIITLSISLISQIGDIFISFIKRKARVKDTSDILPGHGGVLDRIDGIIFAIPMGFLLFKYL